MPIYQLKRIIIYPPDHWNQPKDHMQKEHHNDEGDHTYSCSTSIASANPTPLSSGRSPLRF